MQKRHTDPQRYFNEQIYTTEKYVIPFISEVRKVDASFRVFEIGCGEGGNLKPFADLGCSCVGVDLSSGKIEKGRKMFEGVKNIELICRNIYEMPDYFGKFDVLIIRDVIEHIHDQSKFLRFIQHFMADNALVFIAFPPWQNPFGGHQQMCRSKVLSMLPYYHLLPVPLYRGLMKLFGETEATIAGLLEIKETGISLERFEKLSTQHGYAFRLKTLFFINPNYEIKFGLKPRKVYKWLGNLPVIRNFYITCGYYLLSRKDVQA